MASKRVGFFQYAKTIWKTLSSYSYATEIFKEPKTSRNSTDNFFYLNMFKALIGISPSGAKISVSKLFSGSISDKELTRKSGLLDLLEAGDSLMADRGFNIEDDLILKGVHFIPHL